jgi:hypothetical protein
MSSRRGILRHSKNSPWRVHRLPQSKNCCSILLEQNGAKFDVMTSWPCKKDFIQHMHLSVRRHSTPTADFTGKKKKYQWRRRLIFCTHTECEMVSNANHWDLLHISTAFVYSRNQTIKTSFIRHHRATDNVLIFVLQGDQLFNRCTSFSIPQCHRFAQSAFCMGNNVCQNDVSVEAKCSMCWRHLKVGVLIAWSIVLQTVVRVVVHEEFRNLLFSCNSIFNFVCNVTIVLNVFKYREKHL